MSSSAPWLLSVLVTENLYSTARAPVGAVTVSKVRIQLPSVVPACTTTAWPSWLLLPSRKISEISALTALDRIETWPPNAICTEPASISLAVTPCCSRLTVCCSTAVLLDPD